MQKSAMNHMHVQNVMDVSYPILLYEHKKVLKSRELIQMK